ncbi:hypothetical protein BGZ63DRAFT_399451 [Mariannaea sp. PMI_226]|nr:hypothetical protein BGZ63DRAFT_399451 [Mariannaea sp. PMI_226]
MDQHAHPAIKGIRYDHRLPPELWLRICEFLCSHCNYGPRPLRQIMALKPTRRLWSAKDDWTLRALCRTSPILRQAAQKVLFHACYFQSTHRLLGGLMRFIRSLYECPNLRHYVRLIDLQAAGFPDGVPVFPIRADFDAAVSLVNRISFQLNFICKTISIEEALTQLLFRLVDLPTLEEVNLHIPQIWTFNSLKTWMASISLEGQGIKSSPSDKIEYRDTYSMSSVRHMDLSLHSDYEHTCRITNKKKCGTRTPASPVETLLVDIAPHVEVLCCSAGGLDNLPVRPELTKLQLTVEGPWPRMLQKLMYGLPSLTHLNYSSINQHGPLSREIIDALGNHRDKLQELHMGMGRLV